MIYDLLRLPKEFMVNKTLDSRFFIKNANLTKNEIKEIEPYLSHVTILYAIEFEDKSQLIFLEIVIGCHYYEHTFQNVARSIASSLPHSVVLLIRYQNRIKIAAFNSRTNMKNGFRRSIQNYVCSPYFRSDHLLGSDRSSIQRIEASVSYSRNALDCNKRIISIIQDWKDDHFDTRMKARNDLSYKDRVAQLDLFYEFEQEDREQSYDSDYYDDPVDGYESMTFEEKNYMYFLGLEENDRDE